MNYDTNSSSILNIDRSQSDANAAADEKENHTESGDQANDSIVVSSTIESPCKRTRPFYSRRSKQNSITSSNQYLQDQDGVGHNPKFLDKSARNEKKRYASSCRSSSVSLLASPVVSTTSLSPASSKATAIDCKSSNQKFPSIKSLRTESTNSSVFKCSTNTNRKHSCQTQSRSASTRSLDLPFNFDQVAVSSTDCSDWTRLEPSLQSLISSDINSLLHSYLYN